MPPTISRADSDDAGHAVFWGASAIRHIRSLVALLEVTSPGRPVTITAVLQAMEEVGAQDKVVAKALRLASRGSRKPEFLSAIIYLDQMWPTFGFMSQNNIHSAASRILRKSGRNPEEPFPAWASILIVPKVRDHR